VSVLDNPFLGPTWEPLAQVFISLIDDLKRGHMFQVQSYGHGYGLSPNTSPYVQALCREGQIQLECSSNLQVEPKLSIEQYAELVFYGWQPPELPENEFLADPSGNPNFCRYFDDTVEGSELAEFILTTLVGVFRLTEEDFFGFSTKSTADKVDSLHKLGRLAYSDGNPDRVIFAMPDKHLEMISGYASTELAGPDW